MNSWLEAAISLLEKSLSPIPQELNEIDWKTALSDNSEKLAKHLSAFANNSGGGYLVYGIKNDGTPIGISKPEIDVIVQKIGNIARHNLEPHLGIDHAVISYKEYPLLIIYISEQNNKPVQLRGGDIYNSYKRSAGQTVKLSKQEVKQMISLSNGIEFESQCSLIDISEDDVIRFLDYDSFFTLFERRLPDTKNGILEAFRNDELIKKGLKGWDILNLGAILFAKDLKIFKNLKRKAVRVIVYDGNTRINATKEQEGGRGYASGFEGLINYIMDQLPSNEIIENALRKKVKLFPEKAIREFVANALIHQDLTITGSGVMVEIFSDRIEITNPGVPLVDVNRFIDSAPKSRNEIMAALMRRLNICEERGSGIDRAIEAVEAFQLPAPKFIRGEDYTRVILYSPIPLTRMATDDRVRACYQHACLYYVSNLPVNNQSVRRRFNIPKNNISFASKIIAETIEVGLIKSSDPEKASKKFAAYVPYWA
jgi:ATP-dependent DNA helicase RecG